MVSGSDAHGTPITVRAEAEGVSPAEIVERFHATFIDSYLKLGLTFDLFTHTETQNHWDVTQDIFRTHLEGGYIYQDSQQQLYDATANRFLPDRYVEGNCPFCDYDEARGDQCDQCGRTYEAVELKNPRSRITGTPPSKSGRPSTISWTCRNSRNRCGPGCKTAKRTGGRMSSILRAPRWNRQSCVAVRLLVTWSGAYQFRCRTPQGNVSMSGMTPSSAISSAAKEWAQLNNEAEQWRQWWDATTNSQARIYNFIGKDNIPFHAMMWPAMLIAYQSLNLPYDVPANEYLNMYGRKFSKSQGRIISILNVLERYQADAWRYALTAIAPEANDVDFTWDDFVERVNNELVANWGNLVTGCWALPISAGRASSPCPDRLSEKEQACSMKSERFPQRWGLIRQCEAQGRHAGSPTPEPTGKPVSARRRPLDYD